MAKRKPKEYFATLLTIKNSKLSLWLRKNTRSWWDIRNLCKRWRISPHQLRKHLYGEVPLASVPVYLIAWDTRPEVDMEDIVLEYLTRRAMKDKDKKASEIMIIEVRTEKENEQIKKAARKVRRRKHRRG